MSTLAAVQWSLLWHTCFGEFLNTDLILGRIVTLALIYHTIQSVALTSVLNSFYSVDISFYIEIVFKICLF